MALQKLRLSTLKLFDRFPRTEDIENSDKALRQEYEEFLGYSNSQEYLRYIELKEYIDSGEPQRVKQTLSQLKYPNSEEHLKELDYNRLKKNKAIQNYYRLKESDILSEFRSIELTGKHIRLKELEEIVKSPDYIKHRREHKKNNSDDYQKEIEYNSLRNDKAVRQYFKLAKWKPLLDYFELDGSDTITQYEELESYINSPEFKERKKYLLSKNKFELSEAYQKITEFNALKKSEKIVWYHQVEKSNKFDEIKRWKLTFSDEFDGKNLNRQLWLTRHFWGEALANKSYSLASERHSYTNGDNIVQNESILKISTLKEKSEGLSWDQRYGFVPKSFEYTSGIINTGQVFRQLYGRFEAKIKFSMESGINHSFWLVGDKMLPHIDIIRQNGSKRPTVQGSLYWQDDHKNKTLSLKSSLGGFNFNDGFFILSIDWTPNRMVWKINGIPYMETDRNIPTIPAYIVISSGVTGQVSDDRLPASFEVDWVRCWKDTTLEN